eukprot:1161277-Pelagomonas_calceolata.AAC.4
MMERLNGILEQVRRGSRSGEVEWMERKRESCWSWRGVNINGHWNGGANGGTLGRMMEGAGTDGKGK